MSSINLRTIHARFDLCERDGLMKLRILQGQEIAHWQDGIDMISYIRQMRRQGYTELDQSGGACLFSRPSARSSAAKGRLPAQPRHSRAKHRPAPVPDDEESELSQGPLLGMFGLSAQGQSRQRFGFPVQRDRKRRGLI